MDSLEWAELKEICKALVGQAYAADRIVDALDYIASSVDRIATALETKSK